MMSGNKAKWKQINAELGNLFDWMELKPEKDLKLSKQLAVIDWAEWIDRRNQLWLLNGAALTEST